MKIEIDTSGFDQLQAALKDMSDEVRQEVSKAVMATAIELRADVVKRVQSGPASGTMYYRIYDAESGWTKIYAGDDEGFVVAVKGQQNLSPTHRASAEGEAPMSDTGRLAGSIYFEQNGDLTASVGSALAYATYLEYGTTQMGPRPFFTPATEEAAPKFIRRLEAAIGGAIK